MSFLSIFIIYILLINILIRNIQIYAININTSSDFLNALKTEKDVTLNIKKEIVFNQSDLLVIGYNISKIKIKGDSPDVSKIVFINKDSGITFENSIDKIEISDITIESNIYFDNISDITIENANFNGYIDSSFISLSDNSFKITKSVFKQPNIPILFHLNIYNGNVSIDQCEFYGNEDVLIGCLNIDNENDQETSDKVIITNSVFDGGYYSRGIIGNYVTDISIKYSEIRNCYNDVLDGSFNCYYCNKVTVNFSYFHDNYTNDIGGSISLYRVTKSYIEDVLYVNSTSRNSGGAIHIYSEKNDNSFAFIKNNTLKDVYARDSTNNRGKLLGAMGYMRIELEDIYFENINTYSSDGSLFYFNEDMVVNMRNVYANNVYGIGIGGLFINTINTKDLKITAYNINLSNSYISSSRTSSIFLWLTGGTFKAEKVRITNTGGDFACIMVQQNDSMIEIIDLYIDEFNSKIPAAIFSDEDEDPTKISLKIYNAEIKNIRSKGVLFYLHNSHGELKNVTAHNIHTCYRDELCNNSNGSNMILTKSSIVALNSKSYISIEDSTFSNVYGEWGFGNSHTSQTDITNVTFKDGYEKNGIFYFNKDDTTSGMFKIYDSTFLNNDGVKGSVFHIKNILEPNYELIIRNSTFYNNHSKMYGGVIYSIESNTKKKVLFDNCKFKNNTAQYGNLAYSLNGDSEPIFKFSDSQTLQDLKSENNMFASNPTELKINSDSYILDNLLSGDIINETIIINIYDDYNGQLAFGNVNTLNMDEIVFYEISIESNEKSSNQAEVIGQTKGYCLEDSCLINNIHVVGDPGHYTLIISLLTYGPYSKFENNQVSMDFDILECDESKYIFQTKDHESIKSCYMPTCSISCNNGKCINDNVCDCSETTLTGLYCSEHYKEERFKVFDILYRVIAIIIFIITTICIFGIYRYKNNPIIKGGGVQFLTLILVGIYFNCGYIITLTMERTNFLCFFIYFLKNMAFSLVFGSIFVKTLRIYIIFKYVRHSSTFKLYKMFSVIGGIVFYHLILLTIWIIMDGIKGTPMYTINNYEYTDCQYHNSHILSILFNLIVLIMGVSVAYSIRHVNENFQEQLAIPIYVYGVFSLFEEIVEYIEAIPLEFKDGIRNIAMIIYTIVILYYLFIEKFYIINFSKQTKGSKQLFSNKSPFTAIKISNTFNSTSKI